MTNEMITRRVDQTILSEPELSIIEGSLHVHLETGELIFENSGLYGVERSGRRNSPTYGDSMRSGQFLFPQHTQKISYEVWDPMFIGLRVAAFDRVESLAGLQVYVFNFTGSRMDETEGYSYLPNVPEQYRVNTDGQGSLWVEPLSGIVVDYSDSGISYFIDPQSGTRLADFNIWSLTFTEETRAEQIKLARQARLKTLTLELGLPGLAVLLGTGWLVAGVLQLRKKKDPDMVEAGS